MAGYPNNPPYMYTSPPTRHAWISSQGYVVGHPRLTTWNSIYHKSVGQIVQEIIQEFSVRPPALMTAPHGPAATTTATTTPPAGTTASPGGISTSAATGSASPPPVVRRPSVENNVMPTSSTTTTATSSTATSSTSSSSSDASVPQLPAIPSSFPELSTLGADQMERLVNDEAAFQGFFDSLPIVVTTKKIRDDMERSNESTARATLGHEQELATLKQEVQQLDDAIKQKKAKLDELTRRQKAIGERNSPAVVIFRLSTAAADADTKSQALSDKFARSEMTADAFRDEYFAERTKYHERIAKRDHFVSAAASTTTDGATM